MEIHQLVRSKRLSLNEWLEMMLVTLWFIHNTIMGLIYLMITPIVIYYILYSRFWPALLVYLCWYLYSRKIPFKGGCRIRYTGYLPIYRTVTNYFSAKIVKTADLTTDKNYIFACFPHGVFSASVQGNFVSEYSNAKELFPGIRIHFATINMYNYIPLYREYGLGMGLVSCNKESIEYILNKKEKGNCVNLFVGGAAETYYAIPGKYKIILKKRKGFVKIALRTGTPLVPVFGFGDNDIFEPIEISPDSWVSKFRDSFKKYTGFFLYLPKSLVPKRVPITTVVGRPIDVPRITNPTDADIDHYHALFTEELIKLFNEHKIKYVEKPEETDLEIVE